MSSMVGNKKRLLEIAGLTAGFFVLFLLGSVLPLTTTKVFSSPDETAVAVFAREFAHGWSDGFSIPTGISVHGPLLNVAGLHPRSMVQQGSLLVPVGFLGMPMLIVPLEWAWTGLGAYATVLLVLSSAYALFRLIEPLGRKAAWVSAVLYLTFPVVLLYENRGLFPNLPVVALGLWTIWLLRHSTRAWSMWVAGLAFGMALTIRPLEAIWLIPWIVWAWWSSPAKKKWVDFLVASAFVCVLGAEVAARTYGSVITIGYWLRDVTPPDPNAFRQAAIDSTREVKSFLPFGIHPRALLSNIETYVFGILGPWIAPALAGLAVWWGIRFRKKEKIKLIPIVLTGWTVVVLFLFYGQSRYADNINQTATIGNSFVRYLLPLVPLMAIGIGLLVESLWKMSKQWRIAAIAVVVVLAVYGPAVALVRDEESILPVRAQLIRYEAIRNVADVMLPPGTIVLSERSDKIFAGLDVVAVSPMPDEATLERLKESGVRLALYHRMLTKEQKETFAGGLVKDWLLVSVFENEALYLSRP